MGFTDLALSGIAIGLAIFFYQYTQESVCPDYGFVFERINTTCWSFFAIVCTAMVLVGVYFFVYFVSGRFDSGSYKAPKQSHVEIKRR